ncbi:hypothetical protein [Vibrio sp. HN007]|uniref:hypothetical protein n=1 Tax=Vibrio iocasae TaxID=3098914 RepID=UPI0035D4FCCE
MELNRHAIKKHTKRNFRQIISSSRCGCLSCLRIFSPSKVVEWTGHSTTAVCPYCEEDKVIGSASGYPITEEYMTHYAAATNQQQPAKQISSKYRSSFSLPSMLDKSVAFRRITDTK